MQLLTWTFMPLCNFSSCCPLNKHDWKTDVLLQPIFNEAALDMGQSLPAIHECACDNEFIFKQTKSLALYRTLPLYCTVHSKVLSIRARFWDKKFSKLYKSNLICNKPLNRFTFHGRMNFFCAGFWSAFIPHKLSFLWNNAAPNSKKFLFWSHSHKLSAVRAQTQISCVAFAC